MFKPGDIIEYTGVPKGVNSLMEAEERLGNVYIGEWFIVQKKPSNSFRNTTAISILKGIEWPYEVCFRLVAKKTSFGYIIV
jgi:hypothetical protein